ncbi:Copper homeostasis protein CutC [uncultured Eubacteriales bacterium]|uniref:PF03932 family protein CutC n=1 Tax=uncultured Eubacteriales bacterium TaxID=172733 RepID=A0A212JBH6_9FIRM|nr:Copper homeostasis protein CutC [uncultured Eubacteriales bacterium]
MKKVQIEICCGSAQDALEAWRGGADRVELCSALALGGLTPSLGQVQVAKAAGVKVMAMVRPREGGFCYSGTEFATMLADAAAFVREGADGVVFGVLHEDGTVDEGRCRAMLEVIGDREAVFHRAIDVTPDWRTALDSLMTLGVTRVLTSGQAPDALTGAEMLRAMDAYAGGRLQILPGAGIRLHNAAEVLKRTGCAQLHLSLKKVCRDSSSSARPEIRFGAPPYEDEACYSMADREAIASLRAMLDGDIGCF